MKIAGISNIKYAQAFKGKIKTSEGTLMEILTNQGVSVDTFKKMREYTEKNLPDTYIDAQDGQFVVHGMKNREPVIERGATFYEAWNAFIKNFKPKERPERPGPFPVGGKKS